MELLHPIRAGRSPRQLGTKGKSNGRGSGGLQRCGVLNRQGQGVAWARQTAKTAAHALLPLGTAVEGQSSGRADRGFQAAQGEPAQLKRGRRGEGKERRRSETACSLVPTGGGLKKAWPRTAAAFQRRLASGAARCNTRLTLNQTLLPHSTPACHLAHYAL